MCPYLSLAPLPPDIDMIVIICIYWRIMQILTQLSYTCISSQYILERIRMVTNILMQVYVLEEISTTSYIIITCFLGGFPLFLNMLM